MNTQIQTDELLEAADIAGMLKVNTRQVSERYAMLPDFPKAIRLPSLKGQGQRRWKRSEILAWLDSLQEA